MLHQASRARRQERREQEEVPRRDDHDVVVFSIQLLEQRDGAPARAEDDEGFLGRVGLELVGGVAEGVDVVAYVADCAGEGEEGEAVCPSEEAEFLLWFRGWELFGGRGRRRGGRVCVGSSEGEEG